jgi:hypothetical protein
MSFLEILDEFLKTTSFSGTAGKSLELADYLVPRNRLWSPRKHIEAASARA